MAGTKFISFLRSARLSRNILVFTVCLLIASLFWLLLAFNRYYTTSITVPVTYLNLPQDDLLRQQLPKELKVQAGGSGYHLLSYLLQPSQGTLTIDGRNIGISDASKPGDAFLTTFPAMDQFNAMHRDVRAISVYPDTIFFSFFDRSFRKFPVKPIADITFEKQYDLADMLFVNPDSIQVTGPKATMDSLRFVETEPLVLRDVRKSGTYQLKIKKLHPDLSYAPMEVSVSLDVDKYTETEVIVPITLENLLQTDSVRISPDRVKLTCLVALRNYNQVRPEEFKVIADVRDLLDKPGTYLKLRVTEVPVFVKNVNISPEFVNVVIRRR